MATITVRLTESDLQDLEDSLRAMAGEVEQSVSAEAAFEIARRGAEVAKASCPVGTGALAGSIHAEKTAGGAAVIAASPHAAFVEFGTGIGVPSGMADDQEAMAASGYSVNASGKGEGGWAYPKADGTYGWTHGQSGRGFMAKAAEQMRREAKTVTLRAVLSAQGRARRR